MFVKEPLKCNGPKSSSFQQNNFYENPKRLKKHVCNILSEFAFTIQSHEVYDPFGKSKRKSIYVYAYKEHLKMLVKRNITYVNVFGA